MAVPTDHTSVTSNIVAGASAFTESTAFRTFIAPAFIAGLVAGLFVAAGLLPFGEQYLALGLSKTNTNSRLASQPVAAESTANATNTSASNADTAFVEAQAAVDSRR